MMEFEIVVLPWQLLMMEFGIAVLPWRLSMMEFGIAVLPWQLLMMEFEIAVLPWQLWMMEIRIAVLPWQLLMMKFGIAVLSWQLFLMEFGMCLSTWHFVMSCPGPETYRAPNRGAVCCIWSFDTGTRIDGFMSSVFWGFVLAAEALCLDAPSSGCDALEAVADANTIRPGFGIQRYYPYLCE